MRRIVLVFEWTHGGKLWSELSTVLSHRHLPPHMYFLALSFDAFCSQYELEKPLHGPNLRPPAFYD